MHILVAIDRSKESQNALTTALDIVSAIDGQVTAVHAVPDERARGGSDEESASTSRERAEELLEKAGDRAGKRGVSLETALLDGDPITVITDYAEQQDVDAIYVGHRGLSSAGEEFPGERRGSLGSVSKGLVEHTEIPVTVFDRGL